MNFFVQLINFLMFYWLIDSYICPGKYRCHGSSNCLIQSQICDGIRDCLQGDDELFCGELRFICKLNESAIYKTVTNL